MHRRLEGNDIPHMGGAIRIATGADYGRVERFKAGFEFL
jgi:hypothetical protein